MRILIGLIATLAMRNWSTTDPLLALPFYNDTDYINFKFNHIYSSV